MNADASYSAEGETEFQRVKRIMSLRPDFDPLPAAPWTDDEFQEFARQEPLPPNQSFQLPAEEPKPEEHQPCLF